MADWRTMYDSNWVKAWDLGGKDWTVEIARVEAGTVEDKSRNKKDRIAILWLKGGKKPLGLNKTNCKTIAGMYGNETSKWVGKSITLFPTQTQMAGNTVDCIRIRPTVPKAKPVEMPNPEPPKEEEQQRGA